jgi:anti-sigma factor RsiW
MMEAPIHVDLALLECYRDGESVPELRDAIEAHLASCEWCRMELARIQAEPPARAAQPDPDGAGLSSLLTHLRSWESSLPAPEMRGVIIRLRAAKELGVYLGGSAAQHVLQPVSDDAGNLIPSIQPLLGLFLGRKAAAHLSSHIVDLAVVRR